MLSYEIAKQLKDAGFPIGTEGYKGFENGEHIYYPTLSELISACGDNFISLERKVGNSFYYGFSGKKRDDALKQVWWDCPGEEGLVNAGDTPEEAVAALWLALNASTAP